ncbi:MAG TPA: MFS transporter [Actinospica sp.]|jgi:MFS family permease|nr:MFS transporter [Actinospica sp.]
MPPSERSRLPGRVRLLIAARAVNQLGAFSLAFLTVLLNRDLGASLTAAGAVSAAFGLATIPSRLLGGRLADRWGRRRTILAGLTGCAAAQLGLAAAPGPAVAAVFAVLLGLAFELYEPPSQAMIADAVAPADRTSAYALLTTALAVGNLGAGLIADAVGHSSLRWLFVADAASCLACALVVRLALEETAPRPAPAATATPWRDRALLTMTATGTVFALVYMLTLVSLPLSLGADGINPADTGLLMVAATGTLVLARPALRTRPLASLAAGPAFAAGYALMAAGLAGYAVAHTLPALIAPTALYSLGNLLLMGRAFAVVSALAPAGAAAGYLAVYGLSWGFATVLAPLLGTWLIGAFGPGALWAATSGLCVAMGAAQPRLLRRISRPRPPATAASGHWSPPDCCSREHARSGRRQSAAH